MSLTVLRPPSVTGNATAFWWQPGPEDDPVSTGIEALRKAIHGDHPHSGMDFLRWFLSGTNPAGAGGGVVIVRGEEVMGFAGLAPRQIRIDASDRLAAWGFDYMVSRQIGSAGSARYALKLANIWTDAADEMGFDLRVSCPNAKSQKMILSRHVKWSSVGHPVLMVRPLRRRRGARRRTGLARSAAMGTAGLGLDLLTGARAAIAGRIGGEMRMLDLGRLADRAAIDALWNRRKDDRTVSLVRDAANLAWRYTSHPVWTYHVAGQEREGRLEALAVTCQREIDGWPAVLLVDALMDPARTGDNAALVGWLVRRAAADGAVIAAAECIPGTALARALRRAGFAAVPRRFDPKPFHITVRDTLGQSPSLCDLGSWSFAWGDIDVV